MRPALLIGAGLAALVALAAPARAAEPQPCANPNVASASPCPQAPCVWASEKPCGN
jgi:hypothetical protein